ncbi:MAG TPA: hypothetical protein PLG34_03395 [Spirochaetota bacterium]|jgi:hypothetical protein|nr:MAG: hypothetical protein BWX91_00038 [Spirochaetes bacterium ADurb.Bin133]HNZ25776.1 hypothetical protein [Spirochaetota bacterium]HPY87007.1 hypothetical protein [Spirochaetota bacterium]HQB61112.1 hypothetical protein [Spirochaetota bacterium]
MKKKSKKTTKNKKKKKVKLFKQIKKAIKTLNLLVDKFDNGIIEKDKLEGSHKVENKE